MGSDRHGLTPPSQQSHTVVDEYEASLAAEAQLDAEEEAEGADEDDADDWEMVEAPDSPGGA